jgi:hypothetical protein
MIEHPNVIPIAVVVAIFIFLAKEALEFSRRARVNSRKMHAIRRFLASECERNGFAIEQIIEQARAVDEAQESGWPIVIEERGNGPTRLTIRYEGVGFSSSVVRQIHTEAAQKHLFDVASLDETLFGIIEKTLDTLVEAKHVRDSLVSYIQDDPNHLCGFAAYANDELDEALDAVRELYFQCTNEPLARGRVR